MAAALELGVTGLILIIIPELFSRLVFGAQLSPPGLALGRFAGIALLSMGFLAWPRPRSHAASGEMVVPSLSIYNLLASVYLTYLGAGVKLSGLFLWPVVAIHAILAVLFIRAFIVHERQTV
ncbi:MAG TPA: hypothetical protein VGX91_02610 [Candidatus Cybelea sp.]|nr:hypothetical protein [Candidatus Cybelea sp.]